MTARRPPPPRDPPPPPLAAAPQIFHSSDFVPSRLADPALKARFASHFCRFLAAGCPPQLFHSWFYKHLRLTFGLPPHASRADLLSRWFVSHASKADFVRRLLSHVPAPRPELSFADVELRVQEWLTASGAAAEYAHRSVAQDEAAERHLLRVLMRRYPDELGRDAVPAAAPVQPDLFT